MEYNVGHRIADTVHSHVPNDQAGFTPRRSCYDQVLSLVTHIEAGFQDKMKTAVVLVDLSSAFDTVWREAMLLKLARIIKCKKTVALIDAMLSNRLFRVFMGDKITRGKRLPKILSQAPKKSQKSFENPKNPKNLL